MIEVSLVAVEASVVLEVVVFIVVGWVASEVEVKEEEMVDPVLAEVSWEIKVELCSVLVEVMDLDVVVVSETTIEVEDKSVEEWEEEIEEVLDLEGIV